MGLIILITVIVVAGIIWSVVPPADEFQDTETKRGTRKRSESQGRAQNHVKTASSENRWEDSSGDESIRLLQQIEKNTSATHFWVRVCGIPVLLGCIAAIIAVLASIK